MTIFFFYTGFSQRKIEIKRNRGGTTRFCRCPYNVVFTLIKRTEKKGHIKVDTFSISNPYLNDNSWEMCLVNGQHLEGRIEPDKERKKEAVVKIEKNGNVVGEIRQLCTNDKKFLMKSV